MAEYAERKLTPAQILLIVVVSVLMLLFVILLAGRLSGGTTEPGAQASARDVATEPVEEADDAADADPAAPAGTQETQDDDEPTPEVSPAPDGPPEYFRAPSGNIVCAVTVDSADCVIANFNYDPADADSCSNEGAGGHLRVESAGSSMPCEPIVVAGEASPLAYGETMTAHGYTCGSAESGITCTHDESGYGFTVARAAYELF